ncbi:hypothetical protein caldi_24640 [Caldinitratiruptor microaerophilus]|uniref:Uncharacterized protein n=1 Tax=Caldinitratiruptor microaerophilus TaxID=671077 RepID=A0AA35CMU0_9FIRM|nr:hypothetical protein caldi_24640 [Caldinitratiruptor microaerophilus]
MVHLRESGERRAIVRTEEGETRWVREDDKLLVELPNRTKKVRNLTDTGHGS